MSSMHPVRAAREVRKWTRTDLAFFAQVSERTIANVEAGHPVSRPVAFCIAHALGEAPTDLFPGRFAAAAPANIHPDLAPAA